jgi:hypothetical protein
MEKRAKLHEPRIERQENGKAQKIQNGESHKISEKRRSEDRGRRQARRKEGGPRDRLGLIASVVVAPGDIGLRLVGL